MKKLYTIALTAIASLSALAVQLPDETKWKYLGEATYTDGLLYCMYDGLAGATYQVPCYQSTVNPDKYLFWDIYPESESVFIHGIYHVANIDEVSSLILDKTKGNDAVTAEISLNLTDGGPVTAEASMFDINGKYQDGIFSFPDMAFDVYFNAELRDGVDLYSPGWSKIFSILLPGVDTPQEGDYSVTLKSSGFCGDDNKINVDIILGADVTKLKYSIADGIKVPKIENVSAESVGFFDVPAENHNHELTLKEGWQSILFVAVDEKGKGLDGNYFYAYGQPKHHDDEWYDLGEGLWTDDALLAHYPDVFTDPNPTFPVSILENKEIPGLFRIIDPMKNSPSADKFESSHPNHKHYFDIDASDDEAVKIPRQPLGAKYEYDWSLRSLEDGLFEKNIITFPAKGLGLNFPDDMQVGFFTNISDEDGLFALEIPYLVNVTVKDTEGNTLADAVVATENGREFTTDKDGMVAFGADFKKSHKITAKCDGFEDSEMTIEANKQHQHDLTFALKFLGGIQGVTYSSSETYKVYNIDGTLRAEGKAEILNGLPAGLYIVNGKKIVR